MGTKREGSLEGLKARVPEHLRSGFIEKVDPVNVRMLRDDDADFVGRVQRYLVGNASPAASKLGYDRIVFVPRMGRNRVLFVASVA